MADDSIEAKALALVNEICLEKGVIPYAKLPNIEASEALCRAIERHEAFKQEVRDVVYRSLMSIAKNCVADAAGDLSRFIIPKPKPDPLVDVVLRLGWDSDYVPVVRATLDFFDLEIREKGQ
jgi:hypothetical protein